MVGTVGHLSDQGQLVAKTGGTHLPWTRPKSPKASRGELELWGLRVQLLLHMVKVKPKSVLWSVLKWGDPPTAPTSFQILPKRVFPTSRHHIPHPKCHAQKGSKATLWESLPLYVVPPGPTTGPTNIGFKGGQGSVEGPNSTLEIR